MKLIIILLSATSAAAAPTTRVGATAPLMALQSRKRAGLKVAAGAALGSVLQGFNTGVIAGALLGISGEFGLAARPAVTGLIASSTTMGAVAGTACSGKLCDLAGRQRALVLSSVCFLLGGLLMTWSPGSGVLIGGRVVVGIAAGLVSSAVPTYIAECAEPAQRGALSTLPQLCVSTGILLSYLVGLGALLLGFDWRAMLGASLLPALLQASVVLTLPESPRWLLSTRRDAAAARAALARLRGTEEVDAELAEMKAGLAKEAAAAAVPDASTATDEAPEEERASLLTLWRSPRSRRSLLLCSALQLGQQFCGVNAIVYFTPTILKLAGAHSMFTAFGVQPDVAAMLATVLAYLPKIPSVLLASYLIDRKGRRWMLLGFIPPLAVCLAVLAVTVGGGGGGGVLTAAAATAAVTLFGIFFGMSLGPLPNILAAELFPTNVRAAGVSATTTVQWLSNMLVAALFPVATAALGMRPILLGFAGVCVATWFIVLAFLPETKGVALEDIGASTKED